MYSAVAVRVTPPEIVRTHCLFVRASATVSRLMIHLGTNCISVGAIVVIDTPGASCLAKTEYHVHCR
jgi:hypothetical protein